MDTTDKIIFGIFAGILLGLVTVFVLIFNIVDDDYWNEAPNGCYVHEVRENHFGPDTVTITELCPVK